MRNSIAVEYIIAIGITSWAAIKGDNGQHYWPWPPTIIYTSIAFGILGLLAIPQPELAGVLGAGFMLAQLIKVLTNGTSFDLSGLKNNPVFDHYAGGIAGESSGSFKGFQRIPTL